MTIIIIANLAYTAYEAYQDYKAIKAGDKTVVEVVTDRGVEYATGVVIGVSGRLFVKVGKKLYKLRKVNRKKLNKLKKLRMGRIYRKNERIRKEYYAKLKRIKMMVKKMKESGKYSDEEIAKEAYSRRRRAGMLLKMDMNPKDRAEVFKRNIEKYGNKWGPTLKYHREVKEKSWEQIIESSYTSGGKDLKHLMKK